MLYSDGNSILLGDFVDLGGGMTGVVVCCFDNSLFAPNFHKNEWDDFKTGVMIQSKEAGLIYYPEESDELTLLQRIKI